MDWQARHHLTGGEYQSAFDGIGLAGYRLADVSGYDMDGRVRYAGIWERTPGSPGPDWRARHGVPAPSYQQLFNQMKADGFRPIRLSGYATSTGVQFAGIWIRDGVTEWQADHNLSASDFAQKVAQLADNHYHLIDITAYEEQGQAWFAGIWQRLQGPRPAVRIDLDAGQHQLEVIGFIQRRFVPLKVVGYSVQGTPRYASIWVERPSRGWHARHGITAEEYQQTFDEYRHQGFRLVQACGYATADGVRFTCIWTSHYFREVLALIDDAIRDYCIKHTAPGLSLAVSREGRLIYARAFGFASVWPITPLRLRHRMRIASLSKPVTAVAVMALAQQGRLALDDLVFGPEGLLGVTYGTTYHGRELEITVRHLLAHLSGYTMPEPADEQQQLNAGDLVKWVIANRDPLTAPGSTFTYLNFGYIVLGRVIERVTGQTYEAAVRDLVLTPAQISTMTIGGDTAAARKPDEVTYYAAGGDQDPYTVPLARADASHGWIANAVDLLRFLRVVDGRNADILTVQSIATMTTASAANASYALGWDVSGTPGTRAHNGTLPGTVAFLRLRDDGDGLAAVTNTRQPMPQQTVMQNDLAGLLESIRIMLIPSADFDLFVDA